jgi:hypothetical protein
MRLKWLGYLLILPGCAFGGYSFFSNELPSPSSMPIESAGIELSDFEEGYATTQHIFIIGSSLFLIIGCVIAFMAKRKLKKIEKINE